MPDQQIAEGLGRCDNARTETVIREYGFVQLQDGCGCAAGQLSQQQAVFVEKLAQNLGNGKDPLPVRNVFQNIFFDPFPPDQCPLLGAGGAEKAGLAGESYPSSRLSRDIQRNDVPHFVPRNPEVAFLPIRILCSPFEAIEPDFLSLGLSDFHR